MNFGLPQKTLEQILTFLQSFEEIEKVKIYGSRALGTYKKGSDIDLAFYTESNKDITAKLLAGLEELPTPYKFDVTNYNEITNQSLKEHIDKCGVVLKVPYKDWRNNEYKQEREEWCVNKMCQLLGINNYEMKETHQNDSVDVVLKVDNQKYKIQVTEIAPENPKVKDDFARYISGVPFSNLKKETTKIIQEIINKKYDKHYSDASEINLLVYLNGHHEVFLDSNLDIDLNKLIKDNRNSPFLSIALLMETKVLFLKNNGIYSNSSKFL